MNAQIACPNCRSTIPFRGNGNVMDAPLTCPVCGQTFAPRFYCPDARSPARHIFTATTLHFDNTGALYAFCPQHTFTTYTLAADTSDGESRHRRTPLRSFVRFLDSMVFRLTLSIAALRWQAFSRRQQT
jgi:hypothetical protein